MKEVWSVILFFVVESLITATLFGFFKYLTRVGGYDFEIEQLFRNIGAVFFMRILLLQAVVEIVIILIIVRYAGWEKFWFILAGVFVSVVIWGGIIGLLSENDFSLLKAAFTGYGIPLFLGTLFSWWFCYKWIGLKV